MWFDCFGSVTLPHGAVGLFAVCDCAISKSYSLAFFMHLLKPTVIKCKNERVYELTKNDIKTCFMLALPHLLT